MPKTAIPLVVVCLMSLLQPAFGMTSEAPADHTDHVVTDLNLRANCGPNCLAVFLRMHGIDSTVPELARLSDKGPEGSTLEGLRKAAVAKGLHAQGARVSSPDDLRSLGHAAIVLVRSGRSGDKADHYVLVTGFAGDAAQVIDPPKMPFLRKTEVLARQMEGRVLLLSTGPIVIQSGPEEKRRWSWAIAGGVTAILLFSIGTRVLTRRSGTEAPTCAA